MEQVNVTIIGAGVVGLAVAASVAEANKGIILLERHEGFGRETSSRSSQVIHAGIYYPEGSLKARLCTEGNKLLYQICRENNIPHRPLGKLIVANTIEQENGLQELLERGRQNGAEGLEIISAEQVHILEPHIRCRAALLAPTSGIVDAFSLMRHFESSAKGKGARIAYRCELKTIEKTAEGYKLGVLDVDGQIYHLMTRVLINCAGLESGNMAGLAGIDIDRESYRIRYSKGEFFRVGGGKQNLAKRLIYPFPPRPGYVGIHTVPDLDGNMKLGPHGYFIKDIDYRVDETHRQILYESVRAFLPFIEKEDLEPESSGIQAMLQQPGEPVKDFVITHEADKGLPGLINLIGIDSPGLTSSAAIGMLVGKMVREIA